MRLHEENQGRKLSTSEWYDNMMSDDDRDIDIESDDGDDSDNTKSQSRSGGGHFYSQAEKRAHHNALERKRRDHIKDSFTSLRDSVPSLQGEKVRRTPFRHLETARATGNFVDVPDGINLNDSSRESDSSDLDEVVTNNNNNGLGARRNKKMKTNSSY
uniref:Uncharacterized protein n=1 Tax=Anopheles atroparvus TaxID=41427 RepID=A0A182J761_ANOAO